MNESAMCNFNQTENARLNVSCVRIAYSTSAIDSDNRNARIAAGIAPRFYPPARTNIPVSSRPKNPEKGCMTATCSGSAASSIAVWR